MKKIEAVIRPGRFEEVKQALGKFGIKGMTVTGGDGYSDYVGGGILSREAHGIPATARFEAPTSAP